jgi:ankyrin repeat protein
MCALFELGAGITPEDWNNDEIDGDDEGDESDGDDQGDKKDCLHVAAEYGRLDAMHFFLGEGGLDINRLNEDDESAFFSACRAGQLEMVQCLVEEYGVAVDPANYLGVMPLAFAAMNGHSDVLRYLVKRGANINNVDVYGDTPLHSAVREHDLDLVRCMVKELGANLELENVSGQSPFFIAVEIRNPTMVRLLLSELGADVNGKSGNCFSPLHMTAQENRVEMLQCLVSEFGADVNKLDEDGDSPLNIAAQNGSFDCVRLLVKFGSKIDHANYKGYTSLLVAAEFMEFIAKWLVKAGANPQLAHTVDGTAADISRACGASPEQTAYLEAKAHCAHPGCSGAGTKKCQGCMQARFCGLPCHLAHWPAHKAECRRLGALLTSTRE